MKGFNRVRVSVKTAAKAATAGMAMVAGNAMAALPAEATGAFTALASDAAEVITSTWGIVTIIVVGFAVIGYVKRGLKQG